MPLQGMFEWPVRVYYEDTDSGGVVYFANYQKYMERARTEWLRSVGIEQDHLLANENVIFAVRQTLVDYTKPARFNDALLVVSKIAEKRKVSFTFDQKIFLQSEFSELGETAPVLCSAMVKVASLDGETFKPKRIPSHLEMELKGAN